MASLNNSKQLFFEVKTYFRPLAEFQHTFRPLPFSSSQNYFLTLPFRDGSCTHEW